jgi:SAM-dependent methyltransferase
MRPLVRARLDALDAVDRVRGRRDPRVPPRRLVFVGPGDYRATGAEFFELFRRAGLRPDDDVLDVGSGIGRMAVPLVGWLQGRYEGFDVVRKGVDWCRGNITPRHPNFRFTHVDLYNGDYNPTGRLRAEDFRFPYPDASFDFAFLTSVFTHLLPADIRRYAGELSRVVRPGGTMFATWFLLDADALASVDAARAQLAFVHRLRDPELGDYRTVDVRTPEEAVAYSTPAVRALLEAAGLPVAELWPGRWPDRDGASLQDVTVSRRAPAPRP